jgi:CDP-diacylglycerol--serine O-phosphatidyltransferase
MIVYRIMTLSLVNVSSGSDVLHPGPVESLFLYSAFLVAVFSALRLAKFNLDAEQVKSFKGLPTPANALFFVALGFIAEQGSGTTAGSLVFQSWFLLGIVFLSCFLLVSNLRMFSLKFASLSLKGNEFRYVFLVISAVLLAVFGMSGLAGVIPLYIGMSLLHSLVCQKV